MSTETKVSLKEVAINRRDQFSVPPDILRVKPDWNSRDLETPENIEHIESLALSIAEMGVQTPLTVFTEGGVHYVADGHRRLAAVKLAISRGAEIRSIPVQVGARHDSEADRIVGQIVRNSGKSLTPIEQASVFKRLVDLGWTEAEIARKIGKSRGYVCDLLTLRAAPVEVTDMVRKGEVSATLASSTLKDNKGDAATATETLKTAVKTAHERGKAKATAKDVGMTQGATLALVRRLLSGATVSTGWDEMDVAFTLPKGDWARIRAALKIK